LAAKVLRSVSIFFQRNYWRITFSLVVVALLQFSVAFFKDKLKEYQPSYQNNNFSVFGVDIPRNLSFCGERIPTNDYAIKDNLEKEFFKNKNWRSNAGYLFGKASKWFPYIEPILKREGVPDDFKYLAVIESHLSNATSPAGAVGFWQLVPSTAKHYGLIVNDEVDERLDVEKSTVVACKLIKYAYSIFKNWTLAAAAYNLGIGGIQNAMAKQKSDNYYDLVLNRETGSFVYRILAFKTLFADPEHLGLKKKSLKYFPKVAVKTITVDSSITDLAHFAKTIKVNVALIRLFNPWLLGDKLINADKHVYEIRIPKKQEADYSYYYSDLLEHHIADSASVPKINGDSMTLAENVINHLVNGGQNLKDIADFYKVDVKEICEWNNISDSTILSAGQKIIIKQRKEKIGN
jgi:membrane-bound lytic murein transglycosylase D